MNYGTYAIDSLVRYDAVEVQPVEIDDAGYCTTIDTADIGKKSDCQYIWSVYLHYNQKHPANKDFAGIECVADLPTRKAAEAYAEGLRAALYELLDMNK